MYSNNILNYQEITTSLNANTKKARNLSYPPRNYYIIFTLTAYFRLKFVSY